MDILATATNYVRQNARLLNAVGLDVEKLVTRMEETAQLYADTLACGEASLTIRHEAEIVEQDAHEEFGDSDREIARMLRAVARNLNGKIRYEEQPDPLI